MAEHKDVFVYSTDLISLIREGSGNCSSDYSDEEIAEMIGSGTERFITGDDSDYEDVIDPECWYRVSWSEHVITPQYNSDATYNRVMDGEVEKIVNAYKKIHHRSIDSQKLY